MFSKILLSLLLIITISSCNKQYTLSNSHDFTLSVKTSNYTVNELIESNFRSAPDKHIAILFGYNFNESELYSALISHLSQKFGLYEQNGLILPIYFPDDLKRAGHIRISSLTEILEQYNLSGIILLGAPEYTHNAIALLKQNYSGQLPFPVYSFFPQDDSLGTEYISDFVLEDVKAIFQKNTDSEQTEITLTINAEQLLDNCIDYIQWTGNSVITSADLLSQVQTIIGQQGKVSFYTDPETGLQSINHFLLY